MKQKTCNIKLCKAECCGYVPIPLELFEAKKHLIRKAYTIERFEEKMQMIWPVGKNDDCCAFLSDDYSCIIYPDRPDLCKRFGDKNERNPFLRCTHLTGRRGNEPKNMDDVIKKAALILGID